MEKRVNKMAADLHIHIYKEIIKKLVSNWGISKVEEVLKFI